MNKLAFIVFLGLCIASVTPLLSQTVLASTPPMGWNSWDSYNEGITEQQVRATAEKMAKELKPFGWEYIVIDEGWYLVDLDKRVKPEESKFAMDEQGRFIPDPVRYPSSVNGAGLKPLADYIHSLGLKLGIHILRGIPREAVAKNLPIADSNAHAKDAADTSDVCPWNTYNWGVKDNPAGQAYYDSIAKLYASWGVDFVKADCIADHPYKPAEIRMLSQALQNSGRPMVLSLSPGPTNIDNAEEVAKYAQMWRISDDFWDHWGPWEGHSWSMGLHDQFPNAAQWAIKTKSGAWPDADMLPLGYLGPHPGAGDARHTRFTRDEQRTMMTLWPMFRSPLMMGGDLLSLDDRTMSLLTNPEVIAVDQHSSEGHQVLVDGNTVIWNARPEDGKGVYIAVFNLGDSEQTIRYPWHQVGVKTGDRQVRDLWERKDLGKAKSLEVKLVPHASVLWRVQ